MKAERFDIHQHITDQTIAAIEQGAGESGSPRNSARGPDAERHRKPWSSLT